VLVDGNDGADTIAVLAKLGQVSGISPDPFVPEVGVTGGLGDDQIRVDIDQVAGIDPTPFRVLVDGNDGADTIAVLAKLGQVSGVDPNPFVPEVGVAGGLGDDRIRVDIDQVAGIEPTPFRVLVDGNEGADTIAVLAKLGQVSGISPQPFVPEVGVTGGLGDDRIRVDIDQVAGVEPTPFRVLVDGNEGADTIRVRADAVNLVTKIDGGMGNDLMDFVGRVGVSPTEPASPATLSVDLTAGPGDDVVNVHLLSEGVAVIDVAVDGGAGNDSLDVAHQFGFNPQPEPPHEFTLVVNGGTEDDRLATTIGPMLDVAGESRVVGEDSTLDRATELPRVVFNSIFRGGTGADALLVQATDLVLADLKLDADLGAGRDSAAILLDGAELSGASSIGVLGGDDQDRVRVSLADLLLSGQLDLLLDVGAGNDRAAAVVQLRDGSDGHLVAAVNGGDGDDNLLLQIFGENNVESAVIDGGAGFDTCSATRNVTVINCEA
jgi:hypothetical protein